MDRLTLVLSSLLAFCGLFLVHAQAGEEGTAALPWDANSSALASGQSQEGAEERSSSRTIHLEAGPFGVVKFEVPQWQTPKRSTGKKENLEFEWFSILGSGKVEKDPPFTVAHSSILKIPLFQFLDSAKLKTQFDRYAAGDKNPFEETAQVDQPLFCLFDAYAVERKPEGGSEKQRRDKIVRRRILDSPVLTLAKVMKWGDEQYEIELLDPPMATVFKRVKGKKRDNLEILTGPLFAGISSKKNEKEEELHVLHCVCVRLFHRKEIKQGRNKGKSDWDLLGSPVGALASKSIGKDRERLVVLSAPFVKGLEVEKSKRRKGFKLLDFTFGSLFEKERREGMNEAIERWAFLDTMLVTLVESEEWEIKEQSDFDEETFERSWLSLVETPGIYEDWATFALWRKERLESGASSRQTLCLPLIGPVWSSWKDPADGKGHNAFFPRLLGWRNPEIAKFSSDKKRFQKKVTVELPLPPPPLPSPESIEEVG